MWDKRKLLLAAIVFTALYYKVDAEIAKPLDLAPDAVDDMYKGCREEALKKIIHSDLLKQELKRSKGFQKAWSAKPQCSKVIPGGIKEHTVALMAYTNGDVHFIKTFNDAVKTLGVNVSTYENHFHFKSLHFLLMDSIALLYPKQCKTLYVLEQTYGATKGSKVRFGRFTTGQSSFSELKDFEDLSGQVIFNITSCFFANLGKNICSEEDKMLISPAEVFTVEDVKTVSDGEGSNYIEVTLTHSQLDSSHNCFILSRSPAAVSTQWLLLAFVALSLLFCNC